MKLPSTGIAELPDTAEQGTEFKTLFRHLSHYLGGRVAIMLLGFVSFPIFARLFSVEQYGNISLILAAVVAGTVFSKMGLQYSANRYHAERVVKGEALTAARFQSTLYLGTMLTGLGATLTFVLLINAAPSGIISAGLKPLLGLGAGLIVIRGVQSIVLSLFQVEGRTGAYNLVDLGTKVVSVPSILLLAVLWRTDVRAFLWGTLLGEGLVLAAATFLLQGTGKIRPGQLQWRFFGELLVFGAPLAVCELAKIALDLSDRFLVQFYLGSKAVGYYAATYNIASYLQTSLVVPLGLALQPVYMRLWTQRGQAATSDFLSNTLKNYVLIMGAVVSLTIICSADALTLLASAKYREAHQLLPLLITGLMLYGIHLFFNAGLFIQRRNGIVLVLVTLSCLVKIALNCVLLPRVGLQGAAIATLVGYAAFVGAMARVSRPCLRLRVPYMAGLKAAASGAAVLALVHFDLGSPFWNCLTRGAGGVLVYGVLICVLDREAGRTILGAVWPSPRLSRTLPASVAAAGAEGRSTE